MPERTKANADRTRQSGGADWYCRLILAFLVPFLLAACYELGEKVIGPGMAEEVPSLPGRASLCDGTFTVITTRPDSNDHLYQETDLDGEVSTGSFRVIHLHEDLYLAQVMPSDGGKFAVFFRHPASWSMIPLHTTMAVAELASRHKVEIAVDMTNILIGSRSELLAFLTVHRAEHVTE